MAGVKPPGLQEGKCVLKGVLWTPITAKGPLFRVFHSFTLWVTCKCFSFLQLYINPIRIPNPSNAEIWRKEMCAKHSYLEKKKNAIYLFWHIYHFKEIWHFFLYGGVPNRA
ncbi:hypothetical protein L873DRAFT_242888 [Choiromyces venosus 120613-1]|uniref:Uncharacterized protein n=1 Tax=Choiromyces venosus 120613-1 TaxID=1336337 RepID=A0A3N4JE60_9PEZI|nr:hypothetical protein L873DRAFT_242888 [Choiromyces venosus 120613-1]